MRLTPAAVVLSALCCAPAAAWAQEAGDRVTLRTALDQDVYAAGRTVEVLAPVNGDAVLAGEDVLVAAGVAQDLIAAGETVVVRAPVGDDLRVAARVVILEAGVAGHAVAAGQEITVRDTASVKDWLWLAGEQVRVDGSVGGELRAAARSVVIAGQVGGDVVLAAETMEIAAGATIGGDLIVYSNAEPTISERAHIAGNLVRRAPAAVPDGETGGGILASLAFGAAVLVLLAVLHGVVPGFMAASARRLGERPLAALGLGAAALLIAPLAGVVLFATLIGALLGFVVIALYVPMLAVGYAAGVSGLTDILARRAGYPALGFGKRLLALAAVLTGLALLTYVPVAGALAVFALWLAGIGSLTLVTHAAIGQARAA